MFSEPITYLFMLLPIAALSGWYIGRRDRPGKLNYRGMEIPLDYIKGDRKSVV